MSTTEEIVRCAAAFSGALALTLATTPLLRRVAVKYDVIDRPSEHKVHTTPTPYLGGIGLIAAILLGIALAPAVPSQVVALVLGGLGVGLVGLIDDKVTLTLAPRLAVQVAAALLAVSTGLRLHVTGNAAIDAVITVTWIVGVTNAFNLLDNMDGLCAGATAVAGAGVFVFAVHYQQYLVATAAAGAVGGCLGFLAYNKRPATIFMGDAGALTLGYAMAILTASIRPDVDLPTSWLVPVLLLWLPILDTAFVVVTRLAERRPVHRGGKDHLSHRLGVRGLSSGQAVLVLLGLQAVVVGVAIAGLYDYAPGGADRLTGVLLAIVLIEAAIRRRPAPSRSTPEAETVAVP